MAYRRRRTIFGGNSGYQGYSKSNRAVEAEERGLRNKSQMDRDFLDEVNAILEEEGAKKVTLSEIKRELKNINADEWHHTSMYGNQTNYYSPETIADYFGGDYQEEREQRMKEDREKAERKANFNLLVEKFFQDFPEYERFYIDDYNYKIAFKNLNDDETYEIDIVDLKKSKKEIKSIIKTKIKEREKHQKRYEELSDYLEKIGAGLTATIFPESIILYRGKAWSHMIWIDEKTTFLEIKKEIKRILDPYFKRKKTFEKSIKKYKFVESVYYSPYTNRFRIKFIYPFKTEKYSYNGITNDYQEWEYKQLPYDISLEDIKKELDSLKKEY